MMRMRALACLCLMVGFVLFAGKGQVLGQPSIRTSGGLGQYGYIERDASATNFWVANGGYGNIYQYGVRSFINGGTNNHVYTGAGSCARGDDATANYSFGSGSLNTGSITYSSVFVEYCGPTYSHGGMTPNVACFNERSFFTMDLVPRTDAVVGNVCFAAANSNVVLSFTLANNNTAGQALNRLVISNSGTASEGTDILNDAFVLYFEPATGTEVFNGSESSAILYGDYGGNANNNNQYLHNALNIPIPQNSTGGLRCYIVLRGTSSYLNASSKNKTVRMAIEADGISVTPNRDASYSLMRMDYTQPSSSFLTINDVPTVGAISGAASVCSNTAGLNYSITPVTGGTSYLWSLPPNWVINSGDLTNAITATSGSAGDNGNITVTVANGCGSAFTSLAAAVTSGPSAAGAISGTATVCQAANGVAYSVGAIAGAASYTWSYSGTGATISGNTQAITINFAANATSGNLSVAGTNTCGNGTASVLYPIIVNNTGTYIGPNNGDWNTGANWCGGVPTSATNVVIPAGLTVNISSAPALANSITINGGLNFTGSQTLTITASGTLTNNGTFTRGTGTVNFAGAGAVNGTVATSFNNLTIAGGLTPTTVPTVHSNFQINNGGFLIAAVNYASGSTLIYNTGGTYGRSFEWSSTSAAGFPHHVQISNNTTLDLGNGGAATARQAAGSIVIDAGSTLSLNLTPMTASLTVNGNLTLNGNLVLSSAAGGDLFLRGNLTNAGSFNSNNRRVTFSGTTAQSISGNITFTYLTNSNTSNIVSVSSGTTVTLVTEGILNTASSVFQVAGILNNSAPTLNSTSATLVFASTGVYQHSFATPGTIPAATWNAGSTCSLVGTVTSGGTLNGLTGQSFSNFLVNLGAGTSQSLNCLGLLTTITGNLTIQSTGSADFRLTSGTTFTLNIGGNFIQVGGSLECTNGTGNATLIVSGGFTQSGGTLNLSSGTSSTGSINCLGVFNQAGGTITEASTGNGIINFTGTSSQSITRSGTVLNTISFRVNNPSGITISGTLPINSGATFYRTNGTVTGTVAYNATNSNLVYDGLSLTSSNGEWPTANPPVNVTFNLASAANSVTLHAARTVAAGVVTFTSGLLSTTTANFLHVSNTTTTAISGGSSTSYVNGPLRRTLSSTGTYTFPVGKGGVYLPMEFAGVSGTTPVVSAEAYNAGSGGTFDGTLTSISTTEYWAASLISGTLTAASISLTRQAALGTLNAIARSTAGASGLYGSIGGSASGTTVSGGVTSGTLGHFVLAVSQPAYYRSNAVTFNWGTGSSWQASYTADFASTFVPSVAPTAINSLGITVRSGHTVTINAGASIDQAVIEAGATLIWTGGNIDIENGTGTDLQISGTFRDNTTTQDILPTFATGSTVVVAAAGRIHITASGGDADGYASEEYGAQSFITWEHASIFEWNIVDPFSTSNRTYFPNANSTTIPIFRISSPINTGLTFGGSNPTIINGVLEVNQAATIEGSGLKTFRNGIIGTGNFTQKDNLTGQFIINGITSQLGGTGTLALNSAGLTVTPNGLDPSVCSLISNKTINAVNGGVFSVNTGATLIAASNVISGNGSFTLNAGATFSSSHPSGVNGNLTIPVGNVNCVNGSNYIFNGTVNQASGTLMANTVGSLTITNSGAAGNNTITLSENVEATTVILNSGQLAAGTAQTLSIANTGTITVAAGADFVYTAAGGTVWLKGNNTITGPSSGKPNFYDLSFGSGIALSPSTIASNPTVHHYATILSQGSMFNAPTYATTSTLIYQPGDTYNRNVEWGQVTPGAPGYPYKVVVQGATTLNLGVNVPVSLEVGGDVEIGTGATVATVDMNATTVPLRILGNLTIGSNSASPSELKLSTAVGGDLYLYKNFTRYSSSSYTDNNRAIYFVGTDNAAIDVLSAPPVSVANPTLQDFSYARIQKTNGTETITLNVPVGVTQQISFTSGIMIGNGNLLVIKQTNTNAVIEDATAPYSYLDGTMRRYLSATPGDYVFPIGQRSTSRYKPPIVRTVASIGAADYFDATYYYSTNATPQVSGPDVFLGSLLGILKDEYWQVDRGNYSGGGGTATAKVALPYVYPGNGYWRDYLGNVVNPCWNCNVAVAKRSTNSGAGTWDFTNGTAGSFASGGNPPEYRQHFVDGYIISKTLSTFSPFTIGFSYNTILASGSNSVVLQGQLVNGVAKLNWQLSGLQPVNSFTLEHSTDGSNFTKLSTLLPTGFSYNFDHHLQTPGKHFYRVSMNTAAGVSFSNTVELTNTSITRHANPFALPVIIGNELKLRFAYDTDERAQLIVADALGRVLASRSLQLQNGINTVQIPLPSARQMIFVSMLTASGKKWSTKLLN